MHESKKTCNTIGGEQWTCGAEGEGGKPWDLSEFNALKSHRSKDNNANKSALKVAL